VVLVLSTVLATATGFPVAGQRTENDRRVGRLLRQEVRAGDWVSFSDLARPSIDYYLSGGRPGATADSIVRLHFPASFGANPAAVYPSPPESVRAWESEARHVRTRFEEVSRDQDKPPHFYYVGAVVAPGKRDLTAQDLPYPGSVLVYTLNGVRPLCPIVRLQGDGIVGEWIIARMQSDSLIPTAELFPIVTAP
jgi:hypothetical protein